MLVCAPQNAGPNQLIKIGSAVTKKFFGFIWLLFIIDGSYQHILESIMCRVDNISVLKQTSSLQSYFWVKTIDFSFFLGPEGVKKIKITKIPRLKWKIWVKCCLKPKIVLFWSFFQQDIDLSAENWQFFHHYTILRLYLGNRFEFGNKWAHFGN